MEREELLEVARGDRPADRVLAGAKLVNVFSGEVLETEIALAGGRVAGVGRGYEAAERVDLGGRYVAPGLIDAHVHVESSLVRPAEFARAVVPRGVTTVVTDPHEIANVCGLEGIRFMLRDAEGVPLEMLVNASSCVPATHLATAGAALDAGDLAQLLSEPHDRSKVLGLAEVMNFPGVIGGAPEVMAKLRAFAGRVIDGHAPGVTGKALNAYVAAGISSDHEATTEAEAREKLRLGMTVYLREATNAHNLLALLPLVDRWTEPHVAFATDDRVPADLLDQGSIDHLVRLAVAHGLEPIAALRIATANPARHYRLDDRGAVAPGRRADLVVFSSLEDFRAEEVWVAGRKVAEGGRPLFAAPPADAAAVAGTVHLDPEALDFRIFLDGASGGGGGRRTVRVIRAIPDQLLTESLTLPARVEGGLALADPARDLAKIAVVERHRRSGRIGKGFVTGLGLSRGALAGTFAHDHHNLVVIGADDRSMTTAARAVAAAGGGLAVAEGDRVAALLPLPIAGLMSAEPVERVRERMDELLAAARELGAAAYDPFMAMSFLTLEVIPTLKMTDLGLVDVERFEIVPLFV
ncbi:MAG TPA: adenine deaminase [Thermoanaerobaculia bacterium]|nr:adenine deaminase [Thermoanaerobaculia bacterium]